MDKQDITLLTDYLMRFIGLPYHWGGDDPLEGFDCSGLIIEGLKAFGIVPHNFDTTSQGLFNKYYNKLIVIPDEGNLVFFGKGKDKISHVGYCISKDFMIEAGGGSSDTKDIETAKRRNAFIRIRPIEYRSDFVGYGTINGR